MDSSKSATCRLNQFGGLEHCALRPGNVDNAEGWREALEPVIARYRGRGFPLRFRGDSAFAKPEIYELLECAGFGYQAQSWIKPRRVVVKVE